MGINPILFYAEAMKTMMKLEKLALYCIKRRICFDDPTLNTIYELPLLLEKQNLYKAIAEKLKLEDRNLI